MLLLLACNLNPDAQAAGGSSGDARVSCVAAAADKVGPSSLV